MRLTQLDCTTRSMDLPGADGIPPEGLKLMKDPNDPSAGYATVTCGKVSGLCNFSEALTCQLSGVVCSYFFGSTPCSTPMCAPQGRRTTSLTSSL